MKNPSFKSKLLEDPKTAIKEIYKDMDDLSHLNIKVQKENENENELLITLPYIATETDASEDAFVYAGANPIMTQDLNCYTNDPRQCPG